MTAPNLTTRRTHHAFAGEVHVPLAGGGVLSLSIEQAEKFDLLYLGRDSMTRCTIILGEDLQLAEGFDLQGEIDRAKAAKAALDLAKWIAKAKPSNLVPSNRWIFMFEGHELNVELVPDEGAQAYYQAALYVKGLTS